MNNEQLSIKFENVMIRYLEYINRTHLFDRAKFKEATLESLEFDSLDKVELIMFIEDEYEIEVFDEELSDFSDKTTLLEIVNFIEKKV